jgi:putative ABC transport system permease protein
MNLRDIAWQSLKRRKTRAVFVLLGLAVGVGTTVALIALAQSMTASINHKLEKYGANIIITPKSEQLSLSYEGISLGGFSFETSELRQADLARLKNIKNAANVAVVGPVVLGPATISGRKVLLAGVDFKAVDRLKPWWRIDGEKPGDGEVLLGARAASVLNMSVGDAFKMEGRDHVVSGILEPSGSQDDDLVFTTLASAQEILNKPGLVSMVEVAALCTGCPIEEMVRQIGEALPSASVMAIQSVVRGRMETLQLFKRFAFGVSGLVTLVGGLVVMVTMMAGVRERAREIGIFRAIGFRRSHVMMVVLFEGAVLSIVAGALGFLGGFGVAWGALPYLSESGGHAMFFSPWLAAGALGLAMVVGMGSCIYPAVMAARLDPFEALRSL